MLALAAFAPACYSAGDGIEPPLEKIYFPVGLTLTPGSRHLVVANSDFDLQYNAGSVGVLDMDAIARLAPVPCREDSDCTSSDAAALSGRTRCDSAPSEENAGVASYFCVDPGAPAPCGGIPERPESERLLHPGRCAAIDPERPPSGASLFSDRVQIGAFATDVVFRPRPAEFARADSVGRLFIPVRGDATLHWLDIDSEGHLDCGQYNGERGCDGAHRAGDDPAENTRDLRLAPEPYAIAASPEGDALLVSNQTSGMLSLFVNRWGQPAVADEPAAGGDRGDVKLEFALTNLPVRPVGIAALPTPALAQVRRFAPVDARATAFPPGFLVTYRNAAAVDLVRYFDDALSQPDRPYATRANFVPITLNSSGVDSRGLAVEGTARRSAEAHCLGAVGKGADCLERTVCSKFDDAAPGTCLELASECLSGLSAEQEETLLSCLNEVAPTPLDVYVASRSPASLLVGRTTPAVNELATSDLPAFYDSVALSNGPSRVITGNVLSGDREQPISEPRVFVSCFDSRRVFIYDPERHVVEAEVVTGRGPYAMAIDEVHHWLLVGHFTDSYIGLISLDRRFPQTYGKMLASIGEPSAPRSSK